MPAKHTVNPQRASAANKPFITEYRLAFKNPLTPKKVGPGSKTSAKKSAATAAKTAAPAQDTVKQVVAAAPAPKSDEVFLSTIDSKSDPFLTLHQCTEIQR